MGTGTHLTITAEDRIRLEAIISHPAMQDRAVEQRWRRHDGDRARHRKVEEMRPAPHRRRVFKLSRDPAFVEKPHDIVGLYVNPPAHAVVLSVDEKSQIQAPDRTQPGLPPKKGRGRTMPHDDKRNGTTKLFAAPNVLTGEVFGRNMGRHRHQEFIRFLNATEHDMPAVKVVHVVPDNVATHNTRR